MSRRIIAAVLHLPFQGPTPSHPGLGRVRRLQILQLSFSEPRH